MTDTPPVVVVVLDPAAAGGAISVLRAYLARPPFGDAQTGDEDHYDAIRRALEELVEANDDADAVASLPRPAVWPGLAPGGLWRVLVDTEGRIVDQAPLLDGFEDEVSAMATRDAVASIASKGSCLIFDGDSGQLVARLHARGGE
jgi:hypothetical protein